MIGAIFVAVHPLQSAVHDMLSDISLLVAWHNLMKSTELLVDYTQRSKCLGFGQMNFIDP